MPPRTELFIHLQDQCVQIQVGVYFPFQVASLILFLCCPEVDTTFQQVTDPQLSSHFSKHRLHCSQKARNMVPEHQPIKPCTHNVLISSNALPAFRVQRPQSPVKPTIQATTKLPRNLPIPQGQIVTCGRSTHCSQNGIRCICYQMDFTARSRWVGRVLRKLW